MTPPRRDAHGGWLVAMCLTLGGNAAAVAAGVRPHIVFLMADDLCALPITPPISMQSRRPSHTIERAHRHCLLPASSQPMDAGR
eukprot:COSAG01_NODE_4296_length_5164_cov_3.628701_2_plen_84_part_00